MSVPVGLEELSARLGEYGPGAYLMTVNEDQSPHVVAVAVDLQGGLLRASVGERTAANAQERSRVTLLWAAPPGSGYCLIVDGEASLAGEGVLVLRPTVSVLHRTPDGDPSAPMCVTVLARRG